MNDADGYTLHPCFGHAPAEPEQCTHPITAQFSNQYIDFLLMCGTKIAPDQTLEPEQTTWPPPAKPKKGEYWRRAAWCLQVRCMACHTLLNEFPWLWVDTGRSVR